MAVDEAALDAFLASDGEVTPANDATQEAADTQLPEGTDAPTSEPSAEGEPATQDERDTFDRTYVEKLRRESASYRERAKRYQEAFDGYEDGQVDAWLGLARQLREDPRATAQELQALAEQINQAYEADLEAREAETDQGEQYLTRAQVEEIFQERERQADLQRRVNQIEADARELGYNVAPDNEDYQELLWVASRTESGDIRAAHAKIEARNQAIYDRMIAKVSGNPNRQVPTGTTPAQGEPQKPKTFAEANEALEAWLASQA